LLNDFRKQNRRDEKTENTILGKRKAFTDKFFKKQDPKLGDAKDSGSSAKNQVSYLSIN
jgi:hypothetical protein